MCGFGFEKMKDSYGMREIRVAHGKTLVLLYGKNVFTEMGVCKRRISGEENST